MDARPLFEPVFARCFDAYARNDAAGCAAFFTRDAMIFSPWGPPARGRDAIAATHRAWFEEGEDNKSWAIESAGCTADTGHCLIRFEADVPGPDVYQKAKGVSLAIMQNVPNAGWKLQLASFNDIEDHEDAEA